MFFCLVNLIFFLFNLFYIFTFHLSWKSAIFWFCCKFAYSLILTLLFISVLISSKVLSICSLTVDIFFEMDYSISCTFFSKVRTLPCSWFLDMGSGSKNCFYCWEFSKGILENIFGCPKVRCCLCVKSGKDIFHDAKIFCLSCYIRVRWAMEVGWLILLWAQAFNLMETSVLYSNTYSL